MFLGLRSNDIGTWTCCEMSDGAGVACAGSSTGFFWMAYIAQDLTVAELQPHMYQGRAVSCVVNNHTVIGCLSDGRYFINPVRDGGKPPVVQDIEGEIQRPCVSNCHL